MLAEEGIQGGFNISPYYPELGECLLVCTTETKTAEDIIAYTTTMKKIMRL